ncbi:hypothetical protein [Nocardioides pacificus]
MSATLLAPSTRTAPLPLAPVERAQVRLGRPVLWRVTAWRLAVVTSALTGVWLAAVQYDVWWTALSQLASLAVAASYLALAAVPFVARDRHEPRSPWLRGALATSMVLVSLAYLVMTGGDLSDPYSVFEHLVTPALVVADFLLVGRNQVHVRWWHPLSWLLPPAAYLVYYVVGDLRVYVALDASQPATFAVRTALLGVLVLGAGLVLYAVGRARRR